MRRFDSRERLQQGVGDRSRTKQSSTSECDVNEIVARARRGGAVTHINDRQAQYGDFFGVVDLKQAMEMEAEAKAQFEALPARVRTLAENDPLQLCQLLGTPEGIEALLDAEYPQRVKAREAAEAETAAASKEGETPTPPEAEPAETS